MEKRLLIAIVFSFLFILLFQAIFFKKQPLPEAPAESPAQIDKSPGLQPSLREPLLPSEALIEPSEEITRQPIREESELDIRVETSLYSAVWSNRGGVLKSWKLKEHKSEEGEDLELVSMHSEELDLFPFSLRTEDPSFDALINTSLYRPSIQNLELKEGRRGAIHFQYANERGTRVEKILVFQDGRYDFEVQIRVLKYGQKIEPELVWGPSIGNPTPAELKNRIGGGIGFAVLTPQKVIRLDERKYTPPTKWQKLVQNKGNSFFFIQWAAYEDNYFAALFLTPHEKASAAFLRRDIEGPGIPAFFLMSVSLAERAYIGPKDMDILTELGYQTKSLIQFGFFGFISEVLLKASKLLHSLVPNWGVSIIILTLIIKILFFPLTYSSMRSMARMQELAPKIKAIRNRYKKAKTDIAQRRKMNEEIMRLYKEQGINPAGGCLPMLIQIPVFWGFFRLLVVAIEFRHSPFIFWIKDLSVRDPFYVTPILMGVTQFISQKMTPTSADPTQQRMMLLMPIIFTFIFMNFQSGLVLYWLTNNVLQIGQQYIMNRLRQREKREFHGKRRKK